MLKKIRGKIENNPIFKFREFWGSLNPSEQKDLWDILSSIRGEDTKSYFGLKCSTTARIRYELLGTQDCIVARNLCCVFSAKSVARMYSLISERKKIQFAFAKSSGHFQSHVKLAVIVLAKYVFKNRVKDLFKIIGQELK